MTHSESFSSYRDTVLQRVAKPVEDVDAQWLREMIDAAWLSDLDTDDCVDMILRGMKK